MVWVTRLELAASRTPFWRATKLRHTQIRTMQLRRKERIFILYTKTGKKATLFKGERTIRVDKFTNKYENLRLRYIEKYGIIDLF